jgi:hypothetical protein
MYIYNKMKNKKYHTVRTFLKSDRKSFKGANSIPQTQIHDHSLSCHGTVTSISGRVKLVLRAQISSD